MFEHGWCLGYVLARKMRGSRGTVGLKDAQCGVRRYRSTNVKVGERGQGGAHGQTSGSHTFVLLETVPW